MENISDNSIPPAPPLPAPPLVFVPSVRRTTKISEEKKQAYKRARELVHDGVLTIYAAAKQYGLSRSTLRNWCLMEDVDDLPNVGRPSFLPSFLERKLADWVLESARLGNF